MTWRGKVIFQGHLSDTWCNWVYLNMGLLKLKTHALNSWPTASLIRGREGNKDVSNVYFLIYTTKQ